MVNTPLTALGKARLIKAMRIDVIGAGVTGLTTACVLQDFGHNVRLRAEHFSPNTHSNAAGAVWYPSKIEPFEKVKAWARRTYEKFVELSELDSGVRLVLGTKTFHRPMGYPWWADSVQSFERISREKLGAGELGAYRFLIPTIDPDFYLEFLTKQFLQKGGELRQEVLSPNFRLQSEVTVFCTGVGSRDLFQDNALTSLPGQIEVYEGETFDEVFLNSESDTYVVPHTHRMVLGLGNQASICANQEKNIKTYERFFKKEVDRSRLQSRVGQRPKRDRIRLGTERIEEKSVIYNYGHGGSGFTLSWGCAEEVLRLVDRGERR